MKKPVVEINLPHVYEIVDATRERALANEEHETLKSAVAAMADRLMQQQQPSRSTEKTRDVLKQDKQLEGQQPGKKEPRPGHGRNGADDFPGARRISVPHQDPQMQIGCACPECGKGKLRSAKRGPSPLLRFTGQTPIQATRWDLERLECSLCDKTFTAQAPEEVGDEKYDETVTAMLAILKYGRGIPFNRIEGMQAQAGIPLPSSTQWEILKEDAELLKPVHDEMIRQGAQAAVMHGDDTKVKILEVDRPADDERTGLHTTSIVMTPLSGDSGPKIALYFSGTQHAGENMFDVLQRRRTELGPPVFMNDALAANTCKLSEETKEFLAVCMDHARRKVVEVAEGFPGEARHFLEALGKVYHNDAEARRQGLNPQQRLRYHQLNSEPVMKKLHAWIETQLADKKVEPNSRLGKAFKYTLAHWKRLTLFLRHAGAPLANSICERAIKKAVLHRKNALFYKTMNGAGVGDLYMSIIYTCELNKVNAFEYLTALLKSAVEVKRDPSAWMPWNYAATLARGPD